MYNKEAFINNHSGSRDKAKIRKKGHHVVIKLVHPKNILKYQSNRIVV